ncbi:DUF1330 domain-containing protein [Ancylobacter polymorphus]|uniref:DUF1330 domain-containing protein n=1 Tax=Ancylobacter polymorphus TaxID=223390 RepID=A0A9E7A0C7_9HYPH|nr:DUF1330 domain-containing protein [Ancylobacter polymorphus]UOK73292.1 DUF1330 domain-containing protein [Ancylobacter polymorphus]
MEEQKPAYFVFEVTVRDPDALKRYQQKVEDTFRAYGGKRIVAGGKIEAIEGAAPQGRIIILEFDTIEQAHAWLDSPEYQAIVHYRHAAAETRAYLVEGA